MLASALLIAGSLGSALSSAAQADAGDLTTLKARLADLTDRSRCAYTDLFIWGRDMPESLAFSLQSVEDSRDFQDCVSPEGGGIFGFLTAGKRRALQQEACGRQERYSQQMGDPVAKVFKSELKDLGQRSEDVLALIDSTSGAVREFIRTHVAPTLAGAVVKASGFEFSNPPGDVLSDSDLSSRCPSADSDLVESARCRLELRKELVKPLVDDQERYARYQQALNELQKAYEQTMTDIHQMERFVR